MRSYSMVVLFLICSANAATPAPQYDFPVTIQDGNAELRELPASLPEEDSPNASTAPKEEFTKPKPKPTTQAVAPARPAPAPRTPPAAPPAARAIEAPNPISTAVDPTVPEAPVDSSGVPLIDADAVPLGNAPPAEATADAAPETPAENPPEIAPEESSRVSEAETISRRKLGEVYRPYYNEKPVIGFQFIGSPQALGDRFAFEGDTTHSSYNVRGFTLGFDVEPKFLQAIGVISFGPTFSWYPMAIEGDSTAPDATEKPFDVSAFGGQVTYQAYWMKGQVLVPYIGYEWQFAKYKFLCAAGQTCSGLDGSTTLSGTKYGLMLQLQWMEHEAAFEAYKNSGMKRSYLVFETKKLASSRTVLGSTSNSYWFGFRFEI